MKTGKTDNLEDTSKKFINKHKMKFNIPQTPNTQNIFPNPQN